MFFIFMVDEGGSGKSTLMAGLRSFAPSMVTDRLQLENLAGTGFEHGMAVTQLEGKRIAIQDETADIKKSHMRVLNAMSSGAKMDARYGGGVFKHINVKLALWFSGNVAIDLPDIDAVNRRHVDIRLKNEMSEDEWADLVEWDESKRPLYELVKSEDAFSLMYENGLMLWKNRGGEFFKVEHPQEGGESVAASSSLLIDLARSLQDDADILEAVVSTPRKQIQVGGDLAKMIDMTGKPKNLVDGLKRAGFSLKHSTCMRIVDGGRKRVNSRWLVIDDPAAVVRLQRLLAAYEWLRERKINLDALDSRAVSKIAAGQATVEDYVETVTVKSGRTIDATVKTYYSPIPQGRRPSLPDMVKDQYGVAPVEIINSFARPALAAADDTGWHGPFASESPWSAVQSVVDGEKWARCFDLRELVDPETGESWVGGLDAKASSAALMTFAKKFVEAWN